MNRIRFNSRVYVRVGGLWDSAKEAALAVMDKIWPLIYRLGISKEQITSWLQGLLKRLKTSISIPQELTEIFAYYLSQAKIPSGDFIREMMKALESPPPGYRWEVDEFYNHYLIKVRSEVGERAVVRGSSLADKIFIGVWWVTSDPKNKTHQKVLRVLKQHNGGVFAKWEYESGRGIEYYGFMLVPLTEAPAAAAEVLPFVTEVEDDWDLHRLSAVRLEGIAEGREVQNKDKIRLPGINSIKYNWKFNVPDLLNGRVQEFKGEIEYDKLVEMLRNARESAKQ